MSPNSLFLGQNQIGAKGATAIGETLLTNQSLTQLDLSIIYYPQLLEWNKIKDSGAKAIVAAVQGNQSLTLLNIGTTTYRMRAEIVVEGNRISPAFGKGLKSVLVTRLNFHFIIDAD